MDTKNKTALMGKRLKELREKNGYTQQQTANYLGLDQSYIAKIEKGERVINIGMLQKLADLFGCELNEVIDKTNNLKPIALAYRATNISKEDLEAIANIKKIALNIRSMEKILRSNSDVRENSN